jgi:hypothetical protein
MAKAAAKKTIAETVVGTLFIVLIAIGYHNQLYI